MEVRKKEYVTPVMAGEKFVANEYVAACYKLACQVGEGKKDGSNGPYWNAKEYGGVTHSKAGTPNTCADSSANRVITDEGDAFESVGEYNGEQGWINGALDNWIDVNGNKICDAGDTIYWHTLSASGDRRWNHWGTLQLTDSSHPNHS